MNTLPKFSESSTFFRIGFLTSAILFTCVFSAKAQGVQFELITGTLKNDDARCIIQTLDSGYLFVGSTSGMGLGQKDIYLSKISKTGQVSWQQTMGGAGIDIGNSVVQTPDSGYAIAGYSNSAGNGGYDVYLARTDKDGALLWEKQYGGFDWDFANSLIQTSAGDLIICGSTYSYGNGNGDVYLLKTDPDGELAWDSAYGGSLDDAGNAVCPTNDGGFFICGESKSFGTGDNDVYLLKTDSAGTMKWERNYGGTGDESGNECKLTADGRNIVICSTNSFSPFGKYENWLMKINALGDTLWSRRDANTYNRFATSVSQTADGGYIFCGHDDNAAEYNMFLYKTDAGGYWQKYTNYGGLKTEHAFSVKQTYDKGYVLLGSTESYGTGIPNVYVLKTDSNLVSTKNPVVVVGVEEVENNIETIFFHPNPADEFFILNTAHASVLEIYDPIGKMVKNIPVGKGKNLIETTDLTEGIYFAHLKSKGLTAYGKLIVRH